MLLENIAPSVGLFNGAQVEFVGPKVNGVDVNGDAAVLELQFAAGDRLIKLEVMPPKVAHLPHFVVVRVPNYTENRGPNQGILSCRVWSYGSP